VVSICPTCLTINKSAFLFMFRMILSVNSDYFLNQRWQTDLRNGEVLCFLCGTDRIIKYQSARSDCGEIRETFLLLSISCPKAYHTPDHPTRRPIVEYHRKNTIPKLKNMSLYHIIYSNSFIRQDFTYSFWMNICVPLSATALSQKMKITTRKFSGNKGQHIDCSYLHNSTSAPCHLCLVYCFPTLSKVWIG
jgi:hypothetical protein